MSSLGSPNPFFIAGKKAYEVERSLRFNDNDTAYLNRTFGSGGNRKKWTFSAWIKRANLSDSAGEMRIFGGNANASHIRWDTSDTIYWDNASEGSGSVNSRLRTSQKFRDSGAWFHLVCALDTDEGTADNRMRMYMNGVEITDFGTRTNPSSGYSSNAINAASEHAIGYRTSGQGSAGMEFDGYMAEINFIDGQQYDPSYFGKTDAITGQWNPKKYVGGYGTTGFYLNFSDNSGTTATTLGKDSSGNGNNFTPNNFSVSAGTGNDSLEDTPTNNFSTINPLAGYSTTFETPANGNLDFSLANSEFAFSTFEIPTSGKWYAEVVFTTFASGRCGITNLATKNANKWHGIDHMGGAIRVDDSQVQGSLSPTIGNNKIVGIKVDRDAGTIAFTVDGSDSGTAVNISSMSSPENLVFAVGRNSSSGSAPAGSINFGQRAFSHLPTDYKSLCSANLPDSTILDPTKHFGTLIYEGNSSTQVITDTNEVDFTSDWVWVKRRDGSNSQLLFDSVRGVQKWLTSSQGTAEGTNAAFLTAFNNGGFTSGNNGDMNVTSRNYVAWNWNAGNTDGKTYTVTVVDDSGNKYRFDGFGTSAVTLDLAEGGTYIFNYPSAHPFRFSTTADGTHGGGSEYTTGVTVISSTSIQIVVAASAPTLYYYCSSHSGMGGAINTNSTLGSSNFDGAIQSVVKANTTAGFSIVLYSGSGSNTTVGHGLGVAPSFYVCKTRNGANYAEDWVIYHKSLGATKNLRLQTNVTSDTQSAMFNDTEPTSSVFSLGTNNNVNGSGGTFVAYCLSEVAGYSKFGSFTGNGNSNGTFIFLGFSAALIIYKNADSAQDWLMVDPKRIHDGTYLDYLEPNTNDSEGAVALEILSNGFKLRESGTKFNGSGNTFIYLAFAESPFKNARAR